MTSDYALTPPDLAALRVVESASPADTANLAVSLTREIPPGSVICLYGNLGSGKTHFSKAFCRACGILGEATSPSFTVINEYATAGELMLYHFDFYRMTHPAELVNLGLEDYFHEESIALIEWPEQVRDYLPRDRWEIYFEADPARPEWRRIRVFHLDGR